MLVKSKVYFLPLNGHLAIFDFDICHRCTQATRITSQRFGAFKGLVEQKNVVFNSFVCKLGLFWHSWAFKTVVSLAF
jgi:hypothetical protein